MCFAPKIEIPKPRPQRTDADVAREAEDMWRRFALSQRGFESNFNLGDMGDGVQAMPLQAVTLGK